MNRLINAWNWLSNSENQKILAFVGGGLAVIAKVSWELYKYFKTKHSVSVTASQNVIIVPGKLSAIASGNGNAIITMGNVIIGIPFEQYQANLKLKEQETRAELMQASAADKDKLVLLEKELTDVQVKLKNSEAALEESKNIFAQAYRALDDLNQEIPFNQLEQAQQALAKGQSGYAEKLFQKVRSQGKEKAAEATYQLAKLAYDRIDYADAYQYFNETADLQPDNPRYINAFGLISYKVGRYSEAELLYQRALDLREKVLGPDHPDVAMCLHNLAGLYHTQGQYAKAEPLYQRALAIYEKAFGPDHLDVALSLNDLAGLYGVQGQYAKAESFYQRALALREQSLGHDHPDVAQSLNNLGALYFTQNQYAKAEPLYQRAQAIWEKALSPDHLDVAASLNNLAGLYDAQGQYAKAEPLFQRALAITEKVLGPDHLDVALSLSNLAALYGAQSQYAKAEPLYQRAQAIWEKTIGLDHPDGVSAIAYRKRRSLC